MQNQDQEKAIIILDQVNLVAEKTTTDINHFHKKGIFY